MFKYDYYQRCDVGSPYSAKLQDFLRALMGWSWKSRFPHAVFLRDYHGLPEKSSFDVDLLIDADSMPEFAQTLHALADQYDLVWLQKQGMGLLGLVVDVKAHQGRRAWLYMEVATKIWATEKLTIYPEAIEKDEYHGLPVPTKKWAYAINLCHGMRKGNINKYHKMLLDNESENLSIRELAKQLLGLSDKQIDMILEVPATAKIIGNEIGVRYPKRKHLRMIEPSERRKKIFRKYYFIHLDKPLLITLHGADGVGKSTVCDLIQERFKHLPFATEVFHHNRGWKYEKILRENGQEIEVPRTQQGLNTEVGIAHKCLRTVYRFLPSSVKHVWSVFIGMHTYCKKFNDFIAEKYFHNNVLLSDRYIYDSWIKCIVDQQATLIEQLVMRSFSFLMRRPRLSIILLDEPNNVYERKEELTVEQIDRFQRLLQNIVPNFSDQTELIWVNGQSPDVIAQRISALILNNLQASAIHSLRSYQTLHELKVLSSEAA